MKISKVGVGLLFAIILGFMPQVLEAETPVPPLPVLPITGIDVIREYALGVVARGYRDVSATSLVNIGEDRSWIEARGDGAEEVLQKLFDTELTYHLNNPKDKLTGRVWLYDAFDNLIFYGSAEYDLESMKKGKPSYWIGMQNIPILSGLIKASLLILNEDGITTREQPLDLTKEGSALFSPYTSGAPNAILELTFKDGTVANVSLANNTVHGSSEVKDESQWQIDGNYMVTVGVTEDSRKVNITSSSALPTLYLIVPTAGKVVLDVSGLVYDSQGSWLERPFAYVYTMVREMGVGDGKVRTDRPVELNLAAGSYRFRFSFENFGHPYPVYSGPTEVEGKGKAGSGNP